MFNTLFEAAWSAHQDLWTDWWNVTHNDLHRHESVGYFYERHFQTSLTHRLPNTVHIVPRHINIPGYLNANGNGQGKPDLNIQFNGGPGVVELKCFHADYAEARKFLPAAVADVRRKLPSAPANYAKFFLLWPIKKWPNHNFTTSYQDELNEFLGKVQLNAQKRNLQKGIGLNPRGSIPPVNGAPVGNQYMDHATVGDQLPRFMGRVQKHDYPVWAPNKFPQEGISESTAQQNTYNCPVWSAIWLWQV